ncbi:MAG: lipopolysaccharide biosynthesis protein [Desulfovibrionaceae bacterium]|nr:lipopolysaccharide biosynthesis protein [Desulfovibrionaceae bacterium]
MESNTNEIAIYINAFKRRKWLFVFPAAATFLIAALIVLALPSIYVSSATVLVEGQEVPQELIQTTVTGFVEERLQSISQLAFNRKNLMGIMERFGLYKEYRDTHTGEELLEMMRENIKVENIQADVVTSTGRPTTATVAFTLSFEGKYPKQVLQTTSALVSLFLEENLRQREEKALTTYDFLNKQLDQLRHEVQDSEARIAAFKEVHYRSLPELTELNLQTLERVQKDIDARQEMIKTLMDRKVYLEGQLATVDQTLHSYSATGQRIMSPEEELKSLRSQYLSLKTTRSEKHPDMIKLKGQIELLEKELTTRKKTQDIDAELESWKRQLESLEKRYTDKHPDVVAARGKVAELEKERVEAAKSPSVLTSDVKLDQENPAYINLKTQIQATVLDIRNEKNILADLRKKYDEYVAYIEQGPQVEQEYARLQRDYQNSSAKFQETQQKVLAARQARELEKENVAEKLSLVEPPVLPEIPAKPKRPLLLVVAFILSVGLGVGVVSIAEFMDGSLHDSLTLAALTGVPVLGVIPYVQTREEIAARRKRKMLVVMGLVGVIAASALVLHLFIMPLDIIFYKVMDKLQRLL